MEPAHTRSSAKAFGSGEQQSLYQPAVHCLHTFFPLTLLWKMENLLVFLFSFSFFAAGDKGPGDESPEKLLGLK